MGCEGCGRRGQCGMGTLTEEAPPEIETNFPISESARVAAGGGGWVDGQYVGTWTPDAVTLDAARRDPALAARLRQMGAGTAPKVSTGAVVAIGVGIAAVIYYAVRKR